MWAHYMSVGMYQKLIDRGWRRSGRYVYKPKMKETCCPLYTIRCHAKNYQPSKSQKKVAKKVKNFLLHGKKKKEETLIQDQSEENPKVSVENGTSGENVPNPGSEEKRVMGLKKAKIRRIERSLKKRMESNCDTMVEKTTKNSVKQISDYLPDLQTTTGSLNQTLFQSVDGETYKHRLSLRLVKADPKDPEFKKYLKESHGVFKKYQMSIHKDTESKCSESQFIDFLCSSPLIYQKSKEKDLSMGAFHQHYLIDDKIIAVGVIDILPGCVSSVYFYYDPDFSFLSLGTYSAIREIQLTCKLGVEFYYMGYYVHSCPKMRYKGKYHPSDLCSPVSYNWHDIGECIPKLDENKYSTFEEDSYKPPERKASVQKLLIYFRGEVLPYSEALKRPLSSIEQEKMTQFLELAEDLAEGMIVVVSDRDDDSDSE